MFDGKICVITGGALGIGRHMTREFAAAGAKVAFVDFDKKAGEENLAHILKEGGEGLFFHGDIADENTLRSFVKTVIDRFGSLDYLINNAMVSKKGILEPCSFEDFNYVMKVGVSAPYMLTQLFMPYFNKGAAIVNFSSTRAFMSQSNTESYSAAKGGITALTHALSISLAGRVRVNSVSPGWIDTGSCYDDNYTPNYSRADTEQHPSRRVGEPADITRVVMFLCDERNSFINGQNIIIDGGMTKLMVYSGDEGWELKA